MTTLYDAIVVLGGGRTSESELTTLSTQRLLRGSELYKQGTAPKILVLGGHASTYSPHAISFKRPGAELRKDFLLQHSIRPQDIIVIPQGRDTIGEAFAVRERAKQLRLHRLLIVTSDKHCARALFVFKRILGSGFLIKTKSVPCGNLLSQKEENEYLTLLKSFFARLPKDLPAPARWEDWYHAHRGLYAAYAAIHAKYRKGGVETNEAYMGVKEPATQRALRKPSRTRGTAGSARAAGP